MSSSHSLHLLGQDISLPSWTRSVLGGYNKSGNQEASYSQNGLCKSDEMLNSTNTNPPREARSTQALLESIPSDSKNHTIQ